MSNVLTISCIVCAYNEGLRIGAVLETLGGHGALNEILVIDDGSTDNTASVVREYAQKYKNIVLVSHAQNAGKSKAMVTGIRQASGELLVFIDADLSGLSKQDIDALIKKVISEEKDISMSVRKNSLAIYRLIGLDYVTGERVIPKSFFTEDMLKHLETLPGFGIESYINRKIIERKLSIEVVFWKDVVALRKSAKVGFQKGIWGDIKMIGQILRVTPPWEIIMQQIKLLRLSKRKKQLASSNK